MIGNLAVGIQDFVIPAPLVYAAYDSIATVTVGSGGSSQIDFNSISQDYQHLQLRILSQTNAGSWLYIVDDAYLRLGTGGSIDTGSNYATHNLYGGGSSTSSNAFTSQTSINWGQSGGTMTNQASANYFAACVIDILDYTDTNKYTTIRSFGGGDANGFNYSSIYSRVGISSGVWMNSGAVNTLRLLPGNGTSPKFSEYSVFALYGIKG